MSETVRTVDWKSVFPGPALLVRAAAKSFHPLLIVVGAVGVLLTALGWWLAGGMFLNTTDLDAAGRLIPAERPAAAVASVDGLISRWQALELSGAPLNGWLGNGPVEDFALRFWVPGREMMSPTRPLRHVAFLVFGSLWQLAVWALIGGVIVRKTIVELALEEPHGVMEAGEFAWRRFGFFFTAPLFPIFGVVVLALPFMLLGLLMRSDTGVFISGLLWIFVALAGLAAAWLLVALMFAFPLLWGAVATEVDGDHFGAISRMYAYLYQRPLHYVGYVLIVLLLGVVSSILVNAAVDTAVRFGPWSTSWGAGAVRSAEVNTAVSVPPTRRGLYYNGTRLIRGNRDLLRTLGEGWGAVFFWTSFAGVYLLMRKAVDDREVDEVLMDDDVAPTPATVPMTAPAAAAPPPATILPVETPPPVAEAATAVDPPQTLPPETPPQT